MRANSFTASALAIPASRITGAGAGDGDTTGSTIVTLAAASVAGSADKGATAVVISAVAIVDFNLASDEAVRGAKGGDAAADTSGVDVGDGAGADATDDETEESSPAAAGTSAEIGADTTPVCSSAAAFGGIAE